MKLRKLLAVTAVAATMTAAFAVNAMADTTNEFTDFTYKDGVITVTADSQHKTENAPYTMLVVRVDDTGLADTVIADTDIKQIDQADVAFTSINVGTLAEGTYEIRLGGDSDVRWGTLTIEPESTDPENPYANSTRLLGNVDNNEVINVNDAVIIAQYAGDLIELTGEILQAADCDLNNVVNINDALEVAKFAGDLESKVDGVKLVKDRTEYISE